MAACAAAVAALSLASCGVGRGKSIKVTMPSLSSAQSSAAQVSAGTSSTMSVAPPASFFGFSCFALNVRGAGIAPDGPLCHNNPAVGKLSGFAPFSGGSVEVRVPPGPARTIQLIGVMTGDGSCPSYDQLASGNIQMAISTFNLGEKTVDVFNDVSVTMRAQYNPTSPQEVLQGCGNGPNGGGPGGMPGLAQWLEADSLAPALADLAAVGNWPDQSPNHVNATQGVPADQPLLHYGILNGHNAVVFDGATDFMTLGASNHPAFDSNGTGYTAIFVASYAANATVKPFFHLDFTTPGAVEIGMKTSAADLIQGYGSDNVFGEVDTAGGSVQSGTPKVFSLVVRTSGNVDVFVNGALDSTAVASSPSYTGLMSTSALGKNPLGNFSNMYLGEFILFNRELGDPERFNLECQLNGKYMIGTIPGCP